MSVPGPDAADRSGTTFKKMMPRTPVLLLALGLLALPLGLPAAAAPPAAAPEAEPLVEKGLAWLRKKQQPDGTFDRDPGKTALGLLTLVHCGVPADDRAVDRALRQTLASLARPDNYHASLAVMALVALDPAVHRKRVERLVRLVEMGQCENGQWSYQLRRGRSSGDNSNTQFAVLALWAGRQAGVDPDPEVLERVLGYFTATQNEDGGWGYAAKERQKSYGSMTATGLAAIVAARAARARLPAGDPRCREGEEVRKALGWLGENLALDVNPGAVFRLRGLRGQVKEVGDSFWRHYWLWSLERAATLAGADRIGERDWYAEGVRFLAESQRDDGSWVGSEAPFEATAFSLLFLRRATRRAVATEQARLRGTVTPEPR